MIHYLCWCKLFSSKVAQLRYSEDKLIQGNERSRFLLNTQENNIKKFNFSQTNNYLAFSFYDGKNYLNPPFWKLSWNNMILELFRAVSPFPTTQVYRPSWSGSTLSMMWVWGSPRLALWSRNLFNGLLVFCNWPFISLIILRQSLPD